MNESILRSKISKFVLISNFTLFFFIFLYYGFHGFDSEELTFLIGILAPITTVYMAAMVRYAVANKAVETTAEQTRKVSKLYYSISLWAIPGHFVAIFLVISAKALFNFINFEELKIAFTVIETLFGAYVGIIVSSMFKVENDES